jgi:hypothetical protein
LNHYFTSTGERVTQSQIDRKLKVAYEYFEHAVGDEYCFGCGGQAQGHAHIVPKARCKQLRKTELIWSVENFFPACHNCNTIAENVSSEAITRLKNFSYIKEYLRVNDYERFTKLKHQN